MNSVTLPGVDVNTNRFAINQGYQYDKIGNLKKDVTAAQSRDIKFDGNNKQTEIKKAATGLKIGEYFYDGNAKRVKKRVFDSSGQAIEDVIFVYSGDRIVAEYSTKPPPSNPSTKYVATDMLGSIRAITNQDGQVISRRDFMPSGEELAPDATYRKSDLKYNPDDVRQKFTGYQKDEESGLDFAEARMYNNTHGRFTAVDPLLASGKSANPQTFNRYVYVGSNPIARTDPSGEDWIIEKSVKRFVKRNRNGEVVKRTIITTQTPKFVTEASDGDTLATGIWHVNSGKKQGFVALHPTQNKRSDVYATRDEANAQLEAWRVEDAGEAGYVDANVTGGTHGLVGAGGVQVGNNGNISIYFGGGFGTPGVGPAIFISPDRITGGPAVQVSAAAGPAASLGIDANGSSFTELGVGKPGASVTGTYVFCFNCPRTRPRIPNPDPNANVPASVNSPYQATPRNEPNCSCNPMPE